ncbi:MAG: AAA family ATPase [Candidatus Woesebacteria bacterium]
MIKKVIIHNYKTFKDFDLELSNDCNIIVGDNETGKSTIVESINLALKKQLNGKFIESELSPYLFNSIVVKDFLAEIAAGKNPALPEIYIELYFDEVSEMATFRGTNNSLHEDSIGIRLDIAFDKDFQEEYEKLLEDRSQIKLIPVEYYKVSWRSFADHALSYRSIPVGVSFIDATTIRLQSGTDYYLQNIISDGLEVKERVALSIAYRKLREEFAGQGSIVAINQKLDAGKGGITDKQLAIAIDISQKANWETNLIPHLDNLPFHLSGKGEQNSLKIMLALDRKADVTNIILIEEPENHLSFSSMNLLLKKIKDKCDGKQLIITTHSSFVLNKLGLDKLILIRGGLKARLDSLPTSTQDYFKKLSGYDTLRLILSKKAVLVEGPSDELMVQRAYLNKHGKLPIEAGIDVINVRGLSFKRFLDIAKALNINASVVTDNDGDFESKIEKKYVDYSAFSNIQIFYDKDNTASTLEPQIVKCNDLGVLNGILGTAFTDKSSLTAYMIDNKTESALALFETEQLFKIPQYIQDAIT